MRSAIGTQRQTPLDRSVFPVVRSWSYCNHAAVGPLPLPTRDAVRAVLDAQMHDGCAGILDVESNLEAIRAETAAAIGASADEIAFLRSTSDGALLAANGVSWQAGDEIIFSDNEFGANAYPWLNLRDLGVRIRLVRTPQSRLTVELLERMKTKRTKLVAVSYVGFLDGYRHDLAGLGAWCRAHGVLFAVDAMQGFGHLPLDVSACKIDFCYFGVAKWLLSPQGVSVVFVRRDLVEGLRPSQCAWRSVKDPMNFLDYGQELAPGARRFEGGTINYPALSGWRTSLELLSMATLPAIERHVLGLCDRLIAAAAGRGFSVRSCLEPGTRSGIVLLDIGKHDVSELNARALDAKVAITIRDSGVRVAPHGYNNEADIDAVVDFLVGVAR